MLKGRPATLWLSRVQIILKRRNKELFSHTVAFPDNCADSAAHSAPEAFAGSLQYVLTGAKSCLMAAGVQTPIVTNLATNGVSLADRPIALQSWTIQTQ